MSEEISEPSRRPKDGPFFQQKLPAWQPVFSAKNAAITFLVMGIVFIPLGAVLLVTSNSVIEYKFDYTDCKDAAQNPCWQTQNFASPCRCSVAVTINSPIPGPVYLYYELTNFYQNHRRYVRSKSDSQLLGVPKSPDSLSSCSPYDKVTNGPTQYAILPCGAIANSIFNDTFSLVHTGTTNEIPMSKDGIAWKSDIDRRFGTLTAKALENTVQPPNWPAPIQNRSTDPFKTDEELMVWMRVAALPNFRKLHRRFLNNELPAGSYQMNIAYAFPVNPTRSRKSFVIGNVSWLGGKNITLGVTCLVTGSFHLLIGCAFLAVYIYSTRSRILGSRPSSPLLFNRFLAVFGPN